MPVALERRAVLLTEVRPLGTGEIVPLLEFARSYYGEHSHQANRNRMEWLCRHNPLSRGPSKDIVVAARGTRIIGCHWKTRLAWCWEGTPLVIPSLHYLAVSQEFQKTQGLPLVMAALEDEQRAGLLGLSAASNTIYQRMRCPLIPMARLRKVLSYKRIALGMAGRRSAFPGRADPLLESTEGPIRVFHHPEPDIIASALEIPYSGICFLQWTAETFRWRFFHPLGPKNFLVLLGNNARAVCSFGVSRGVLLSRVVDVAVSDNKLYPALFRAVEWAMRKLGIAVATVATTSAPAREHLLAAGWRVQSGISSRFFLRGAVRIDIGDVWGGSYDYGFDAN